MSDQKTWHKVNEFIAREMQSLDSRDWDSWLQCYDSGAEYWVPAWDDDDTLVSDPQREISLIYYPNKGGLEDRVYRIRLKRSAASIPLFRTTHLFTLLKAGEQNGEINVQTNWSCHSFREGVTVKYFGKADYILRPHGDSFVITKKTTVVNNDLADTVMDFYMI